MSDGTGIAGVDSVVVWIGAITVIVGGAGMLWKWTGWLRRIVRQLDDFADDWHGTEGRPGVPARPGVMERLAGLERGGAAILMRIDGIEHELHPNSGGSMRDAIDRVERCVNTDPDGPARALRAV